MHSIWLSSLCSQSVAFHLPIFYRQTIRDIPSDYISFLQSITALLTAYSLCLGDGLPSIASVDLAEDISFSESSDLQKARKLYAELQAMSMESTGSTEVRNLTEANAFIKYVDMGLRLVK